MATRQGHGEHRASRQQEHMVGSHTGLVCQQWCSEQLKTY